MGTWPRAGEPRRRTHSPHASKALAPVQARSPKLPHDSARNARKRVLRSAVQFFRTAYEGIAAGVKTQELVGLAREADPRTDAYFRGDMVVARESQGSLPAKVDAVQATIDL